jgi:histidine triad (HIT) family protein
MEDCVFCKIVSKEIKTEIVKETENLIVFKDIHPKAPVHLLIIPKKHIVDIKECDDLLWTEIKKIANELASEITPNSFRLVANAGNAAEIKHMHVHFLGQIDVQREI